MQPQVITFTFMTSCSRAWQCTLHILVCLYFLFVNNDGYSAGRGVGRRAATLERGAVRETIFMEVDSGVSSAVSTGTVGWGENSLEEEESIVV